MTKMAPLFGRERITFDEAAARLGIGRRCLFKWLVLGKFPRPRRIAKRNFYFEDEFEIAHRKLAGMEPNDGIQRSAREAATARGQD